MLKVIKIKINKFTIDYVPGWVNCSFIDIYQKEHYFEEKIPVVTSEQIGKNSDYPREGMIACEIIKEWKDKNNKTVYTVRTNTWGIETVEGLTEFDLFAEQITDLVR